MTAVVLIGTMDTKGSEYAWLAERVCARGAEVVTIDVGPFSDAAADVPPDDVAAAAGHDLQRLRDANDRGAAMDAMADGAKATLIRMYEAGDVDGVLAVGGSGGSSVASRAMQALPVGVPKLLVSTMASGDVSPYVGESDVTLMYSVVDVAGINSISEQVFDNAAAAISAMADAHRTRRSRSGSDHLPLVGLSMFGLTTPAVDEARDELVALGYEPLVFHATGAGGRAMEKLAGDGLLAGVLDLTTTELADDLVGGVLSAGPDRLTAAGGAGLPQVVSLGALDMVNFGPRELVPARFDEREFVVHNPTVTLMRTTREENAELGRRIGEKLSGARGSTALVIPQGGLSGIDAEGAPFHDPAANAALFDAVRGALAGSRVDVIEDDRHINDRGFGRDAARRLHALISAQDPNEE
ncbi:Tm-1-like ATP-binding domain-containing protein [Microbacterium halophytorum]|uniref:Tm-1-like ATP-binding domain-containing protein n=1 Tax=Microbacterium halophytorum TaxID=2067568 RepID=UPI000CFAB016|nr:Tm-1-like ATP-binding domain-containing protein [Microbacterium halophytorum]